MSRGTRKFLHKFPRYFAIKTKNKTFFFSTMTCGFSCESNFLSELSLWRIFHENFLLCATSPGEILNIDWKPPESCDFKLENRSNRAYLFSSSSRTVLLIKLFIVWRNDFVAVYFGFCWSRRSIVTAQIRDDLIELSQLLAFFSSDQLAGKDKLFMWDFDWQLAVRIFSASCERSFVAFSRFSRFFRDTQSRLFWEDSLTSFSL